VAVAAARQQVLAKPASDNLQRELAVALGDLGDGALACQQLADALAAYRESLEIFRQLRRTLGDSPQVLRDLSVSLNKVGDAENAAGRGADALAAHRESLEIRRELRQMLGDSPQVLRDLSVSLNNVGDAESAAGRGVDALAAYRESLEICRQLRQTLGDSPQVLDDLAVSLERLAQLEAVDLGERRSAMQEALALRERLAGATPQSHEHATRLGRAQKMSDQLNGHTTAVRPTT
jgi:tetratricopeptide (TPR) repeat protein